MANAILCRPLPMTVNTSSNVSIPANVLNERMGRTASFSTPSYIIFDMGAAVLVDTVGVLASNASGGTVTISAYSSAANAVGVISPIYHNGGAAQFPDATNANKRLHKNSVFKFTGVTARYWRLDFTANQAVGRILLGQSFEAADTMDIGWEFGVVDLGEVQDTALGLEDTRIGGKVLSFNWTWSWMTEAEARTSLLDVLAYAGTTRPVLVCLDPAATDVHNLIGYGRLVEGVKGNNYAIGMYEASFNLRSRLVLNL